MAMPSIMDSLFQRNLEDLIKGLRSSLLPEPTFISKAIDEIRREIRSTDLDTKATALQKLSYLNSLHGVSMSWADFHVVEVLSSCTFSHKRIGYLAASVSFHEGTDVLLLTVNQLRKDLGSKNEYEVSLALECLNNMMSSDLARDLTPEVFTLLGSTRVSVRRKAITVVLRLFEKYPDAVRVCFKRLVENLDGSDQQSLSATVGVLCELCARDPRAYLPLAPEFYKLLVDSRNNWVLIKVMKIFAKLAPLEERLAKKIVEPICDHMRRTEAKSLLFECIRTVVTSLTEYESIVKLAVSRTRELLVDDDPNLKYLGLQALSIVAPKHLGPVLENMDVVIKSLSDVDPNVRLESLRLVMTMVSEDNANETCRILVNYALKSDPIFCNEILESILLTCSRDFYEVIVDFEWYVSLLGEMARIPHCEKGKEIESQLIDIGMRVKDVRPELVRVARDLLIDPALLANSFIHRILSGAAWVSGEYVEFSPNPFELMQALMQPYTSFLPPLIRAVYIQSAFKILIFCLHSFPSQTNTESSSSSAPRDSAFAVSCSSYQQEPSEDIKSVECEASSNCIQYGEFNPRVTTQSPQSIPAESSRDVHVGCSQASSSVSFEEEKFTKDSISSLLTLTQTALGPLLGSYEVELQERSRNILAFIELVKQEITDCSVQKDDNVAGEELNASKVIGIVRDAFSEELGPVAHNAQQKVPVPNGLVFKENLSDLELIYGDIQFSSSTTLSLGNLSNEEATVSLPNSQSKEESEKSTESTSLLAEHRKRHGLYYLSTGKSEVLSSDYPPACDPQSQDNHNDDDLAKLAAQSFVPKRKQSQSKARPVVVKLDEGDGVPIPGQKPEEPTDDTLSGAVCEVLFGKDSSLGNRPDREKLNVAIVEFGGNNSVAGKTDFGNSSSGRSKHGGPDKERRQRISKKNGMEMEKSGQKEKGKRSNRSGKHKSRQTEVASLDAIAQAPVVEDFLL